MNGAGSYLEIAASRLAGPPAAAMAAAKQAAEITAVPRMVFRATLLLPLLLGGAGSEAGGDRLRGEHKTVSFGFDSNVSMVRCNVPRMVWRATSLLLLPQLLLLFGGAGPALQG